MPRSAPHPPVGSPAGTPSPVPLAPPPMRPIGDRRGRTPALPWQLSNGNRRRGWDSRGGAPQRTLAIIIVTAERTTAMLQAAKLFISQYLPEETEGQGLVEYALIIVLVSIAVIVTLGLVGDEVNTVFQDIISGLQTR